MNIKNIIGEEFEEFENQCKGQICINEDILHDLVGGISYQEAKEMGFLANMNDFTSPEDKELEKKIRKAIYKSRGDVLQQAD